jgi:hypothetical protein
VVNYIESFNQKNTDNLEAYFKSYYEDPEIERRLIIERSLKRSWGGLEIYRIVYNCENEIILLIKALKMSKSILLFDVKLNDKTRDRIEYFTRTGIPIAEGRVSSFTDREALYFADRSVPLDDRLIQQTVYDIAIAFDTTYYNPDIGNRISKELMDNLNQGKYNPITKAGRLADSLNEDILSIDFDSHSSVEANRKLITVDTLKVISQNYGFTEITILNGDIGYVKLNEFNPSKEAQLVAQRSLDSISRSKALILDLRHNSGGYPEMIQLIASYFFPKPVKINTLRDRNGHIVNEIWTQDSIPGRHFSESFPLVLLTSNQTASAAEGFVNLFKETKRGIIIGEPTMGAHHPAKELVVNPLFVVSIPFLYGESINLPEGEGIAPDILVPSEKALDKAINYLVKK